MICSGCCSLFYRQFFCKESISKLINTTVVSVCWGCNTMLCYSRFCHVTQLVYHKGSRVPFCDKAVVCTAPKNLNVVMKWETGKYLALVLSWAKHYFFLYVRTCIHIRPSLSVGAILLLNFVQILCHFKVNNDLKSSAAPRWTVYKFKHAL